MHLHSMRSRSDVGIITDGRLWYSGKSITQTVTVRHCKRCTSRCIARVATYNDALVRVENQSFIPCARDRVWECIKVKQGRSAACVFFSMRCCQALTRLMVQDHLPEASWQDASVVLACLESIYRYGTVFNPPCNHCAKNTTAHTNLPRHEYRRVEYHQLAEDTLAALQTCNSQAAPAQLNAASARTARETASAPEAAPDNPQPHAPADVRSSPKSEEEISAEAEATLMQLLMLLVAKCHFSPLTQRDTAMASSLGSDYLWQLFILASSAKLDKQLAGRYQHAAAVSEADGVVLMKRGYSTEQQSGRLLLQKLDYLQLLLVQTALQQVKQVLTGDGGSDNNSAASQASTPGRSSTDASTTTPPAVQLASSNISTTKLQHSQQQAQASGSPAHDASSVAASTRHQTPTAAEAAAEAEAEAEAEADSRPARSFGSFLGAIAQHGIAPVLSAAAGKLGRTLSNWGLLPRQDVLPLDRLEAMWPVQEPARLAPRYIRKRALPDVFDSTVQAAGTQGAAQQLVTQFLQPVQLVEPTFGEVLLLYRCAPGTGACLLDLVQSSLCCGHLLTHCVRRCRCGNCMSWMQVLSPGY
jgi:hypothetical protein